LGIYSSVTNGKSLHTKRVHDEYLNFCTGIFNFHVIFNGKFLLQYLDKLLNNLESNISYKKLGMQYCFPLFIHVPKVHESLDRIYNFFERNQY
jgi:hypothetical protein